MTTDVASVVHQPDHRGLHAADVGDEPTAVAQRPLDLDDHRADRCGHEGDVGFRIVADGIERTQLERPGPGRLVGIAAGDVPPLLAEP